ncbi:MAG: HAMP domain-containing sensor histidine kinase [Pseudomonadota bacterium]
MAKAGGGALALGEVLDDTDDAVGDVSKRPWFRIFSTSTFRYILFSAFLFVFGVIILGIVIYESTIGATFNSIDRELQIELDRLERVSEANGAPKLTGLGAVINEVEQTTSPVSSRYLVVLEDDRIVEPIAGNLRGFPFGMIGAQGMFEFSFSPPRPAFGEENPDARRYVGRTRTLDYVRPDGADVRATVLIARDIEELHQLRRIREAIVFRIFAVLFLLAVGLGVILSTALMRRLDGINRTVEAITGGDLTRRLAVGPGGDEFDTLARNINAMLDKIEQLMTGMRQVSDNIAHDLRSPLTRIKARLDSLLDEPDPFDGGDTEEAVLKTRDEVERLLRTFNELLSITRIEAGTSALTGTVDLKAVAEEMLELYVPAADDAGFELVANLQDTPLIEGSRELISQAIANLLDNAMKYGRHADGSDIEPTIELTVAPRPTGGALLSVMDNGPGVAEIDRERIVQRFVRLEQSRSTMGNGLGLSLVSAIARRHGGRLSIGGGLPHQDQGRSLHPSSAYGLGVRIAFPAMKVQRKSGLPGQIESKSVDTGS